MSTLRIQDLRVSIAGKQILNGIDLEVSSGEVHAIMGPNGSGKSTLSHALMGHPDYEITGGSVTLDGEELLGLPTHVRAAKGLFLAPQYPVELPGVHLEPMLREALSARGLDPMAEAGPTRWPAPDAPRRSPSAWLRRRSAGRSTSPSPAARRSATRRCSWPCSRPASP